MSGKGELYVMNLSTKLVNTNCSRKLRWLGIPLVTCMIFYAGANSESSCPGYHIFIPQNHLRHILNPTGAWISYSLSL